MTERVLVQASRWTKRLFSSRILHCLRLQAAGFPTLLFFPSWNKSFDPVSGFWTTCLFIGCLLIWEVSPCLGYSFHLLLLLHMHLRNLHWQITVGSDRTVAAFCSFLKRHASVSHSSFRNRLRLQNPRRLKPRQLKRPFLLIWKMNYE